MPGDHYLNVLPAFKPATPAEPTMHVLPAAPCALCGPRHYLTKVGGLHLHTPSFPERSMIPGSCSWASIRTAVGKWSLRRYHLR